MPLSLLLFCKVVVENPERLCGKIGDPEEAKFAHGSKGG
jgi:hypothetical protein